MKKEDLLLVFDFLATALKENSATVTINEENPIVDEIVGIKPIENNNENMVEDTFFKHFKTESSHVKNLIDKVDKHNNGYVTDKNDIDPALSQLLKDQYNSFTKTVFKIQSDLRDNIVSPEEKETFKNFVKLEDLKANQDLKKAEIECVDKSKKNIIKASKSPNIIKDVMINGDILDEGIITDVTTDINDPKFEISKDGSKPVVMRREFDGGNGTFLYE